jgi:hypothetical protein
MRWQGNERNIMVNADPPYRNQKQVWILSSFGVESNGYAVYLYATPNHDDAIPMLLLEIRKVLLQRYTADVSSMPMAAGFTIKEDDGKDVCREFQRDLMNCGFRGEHIVKHYDELRNHLYELRRSFNDKSLDITILQVKYVLTRR